MSTAILLYSPHLFSHPHNWIELSTEFNINDQGELIGITQHWQFDQFFSMINYAELMNEYNDESLGLAATALKMVTNVGPDQYLSTLAIAGVNVELPVPKLYTLEIQDINGAQILVLKMKFALKDKPKVKNKLIMLQTYEPNYFIAMNYLSSDKVLLHSTSLKCKVDLIKASPSEDLIYYANSLDRNIRDTDGLGDNFAEQVNIQC